MKIVIGSGPAGVSCSQALLAQGENVLLLDAGLSLEPEQNDLLQKIQAGDAGALEQMSRQHLDVPVSSKGVELKLAYGSDFAYRDAAQHLGFEGIKTGLQPSLAQGGLSNVWGAAVLPYIQKDMKDWPISPDDLAPHYSAVLAMTGLAAQQDALAGMFPLYTEKLHPLQPGSQARGFLAGLDKIKSSLSEDGILYGTSRLAVGPNHSHSRDCVYCGKCLYGCPYGVIYNSAFEIDSLQSRFPGLFRYQANVIVEKIMESAGGTVINGYDRLSRTPLQFEGDRAFIAAGTIPTSRIVLKSHEAYDEPLLLKDSQYFILPVLSVGGYPEATREKLYTLSQIFLEMNDPKISPYTIHLQVYTYNDLIPKVLRKKLWFAPGLREFLIGPLQHRLIVIQGYLHSDHSGTMTLRLTRDEETGKDRLIVEGQTHPETKGIIQQVARKLTRHLIKLGLMPLAPAVDVTLPGRGFHSGGSFPMKHHPGRFETDRLGRLPGQTRIHLADASVFPSIPATTITLTAMANAHRIASTWKEAL